MASGTWAQRSNVRNLRLQACRKGPAHLQGLFGVLVGAAPVGRAPTVDSSQEVQLDGVLGHPVLELVEELTAAGQAEVPLVQLDRKGISRSSSSWERSSAPSRTAHH